MEWIKTSERLPETIKPVLIVNLYGRQHVATWDDICECWMCMGRAIDSGPRGVPITHWQNLPQPPQNKE